MTDLATNPQGGEAVADDQVSLDQAAEGVDTDALDTNLEQDADAELDDQQAAEDDTEEVDYEGAKYKVPKPLKDALLRQADYTQKTQALAATRQELEQRQQAFAQQVQIREATAQQRTELAVIDRQLSAYTPEALRQVAIETPDQLPLVQLEMQTLERQRAALAGEISQREGYALQLQRQEAAKQLEASAAVLKRDIPGWNDQLAQELTTFGETTFGFTRQELGQVVDPRMVKVLHLAKLGAQAQATQQRTAKVAQAQKTAPVQTVRGQAGRFAPAPDTSDFAAFERDADRRMGKR